MGLVVTTYIWQIMNDLGHWLKGFLGYYYMKRAKYCEVHTVPHNISLKMGKLSYGV